MTGRGGDSFSSFEVLGHLVWGEIDDWLPRLRHVLEFGATRPFPPFDRFAMLERDQSKAIGELLDEFSELRGANLADLEAMKLTEDQLELCGSHPEFGQVTVRQLLATWVVHDQNHIAQIARTLGWQYRDAVGPWRKHLRILQA